jgi:hypothetical protein
MLGTFSFGQEIEFILCAQRCSLQLQGYTAQSRVQGSELRRVYGCETNGNECGWMRATDIIIITTNENECRG